MLRGVNIDRKTFFDAFRTWYKARTKKSRLDGETVAAVDFLLDEFEKQSIITSIPQIAYAFATIAHETAYTFRPIKERRSRVGSKGRANQDRYWLSGYYGRGYVQLTWKRNYEQMSKHLGIDLVADPDLALSPHAAFRILLIGMSKGIFTGKKLSDYLNANKKDYINARKIINGLDKAKEIAGIAQAFEGMLKAATIKEPTPTGQPEAAADTPIVDPAIIPVEAAAVSNPPQNSQPAQQPTETTVTQEAGGTTVEMSAKNEQDVNEPAIVEAPPPQGLKAKLGIFFSTLFGGTLFYTALEKVGAISFTDRALILLGFVLLLVFIGVLFYFWIDAWKQNNKTKLEMESKTNINRKDVVWVHPEK